ncbi:MAG: hypothetical protein K9N07_11150 [Candidatus Cloacimonetes bacterium]|nr:hypothetical protein [Candidatus Cloacimonadota bacterium]
MDEISKKAEKPIHKTELEKILNKHKHWKLVSDDGTTAIIDPGVGSNIAFNGKNAVKFRELNKAAFDYINSIKKGDEVKYDLFGEEHKGIVEKINKDRQGNISSIRIEDNKIEKKDIIPFLKKDFDHLLHYTYFRETYDPESKYDKEDIDKLLTEYEYITSDEAGKKAMRIHKASADNTLKEIQEKGSIRVADPKAVAVNIKKYTGIDVIADEEYGTVKLKPDDIVEEPIENYHIFEEDEINKAYGSEEKRQQAIESTARDVEKRSLSGNYHRGRGTVREREETAGSTERTSSFLDRIKERTVFEGFKESGEIDFIGLRINSPQDIADIFTIHRSPYIEKSHVIFTKDNKIVGTTAATLFHTAEASFAKNEQIKNLYKKFNADGMYLLHNHPSGNHKPSIADIYTTSKIQKELSPRGVNLIGHVIIDDKKFSYINITNKPYTGTNSIGELQDYIENEIEEIDYKNAVPKLFVEREKLPSGSDAPKRLIEISKALLKEKGYRGAIIYLSQSLDINAYDVFPKNANNQHIIKIANDGIENHLGSRLAFVHDGSYNFWGYSMPYGTLDVINTEKGVSEYFQSEGKKKISEDDIITLWDEALRYRSAKPFYSPTEKALESIKQKKGTPDQMKAMLLKNGAKQAELDWMGWDEFIEGKKSVTKEDIQAWIDQNKVEVEEVEKGSEKYITERKKLEAELESIRNKIKESNIKEVEDAKAKAQKVADLAIKDFTKENRKKRDEAEAEMRKVYNKHFGDSYQRMEEINTRLAELWGLTEKGDTKFSQYQLPGGENYKEVLLTMPWEKPTELPKGWKIKEGKKNWKKIWQIIKADGKRSIPIKAKSKEDALQIYFNTYPQFFNEKFKSSHWEETNVLAHIRFNERTDSEGNKVLFLEEIQSDWAQKGREEGFKKPSGKTFAELGIEADKLREKIQSSENVKEKEDLRRKLDEIEQERSDLENEGFTPDMPFKTTPQWVNLALRRMIRYAAENGFDSVAWTPGEIQADRYDLSKQVDQLTYFKNKENSTYNLHILPKPTAQNRDPDTERINNIPENKLEDYVGKDVASKIINNEGFDTEGKWYSRSAYEFAGVLSGEGLKVGGEGLKVGGEGQKIFYDKIVPAQANKIFKKFGSKVGETTIDLNQGDVNLELATEAVTKLRDKMLDVNYIPVTVGMKEAALYEGMPIFEPKAEYGPPEKPKKEDYPLMSDYLKDLEKYYKENPDKAFPLKQKITQAQNAVFEDNGLVDETIEAHKRAMEVYSEKEKEKVPIKETIDKMREFYNDDNLPIRRWQEAIIKHGGKLPETEYEGEKTKIDAYRDIRNMFGRMEALYEEFQQENIKPVIESFTKIIKSGMKSEGILPYMIAKHGLERNRVMREEEMEKFMENNPDATMDELFDYEDKLANKDFAGLKPFDSEGKFKNVDDLAEAIIEGFEKQVPSELVEELWNNTRKATDYTLDTWLEGGQISKKTYDYLKEKYDNFIPLRGWKEGAAKFLRYKSAGHGIGASLKRAFGRLSLADNPIAYIQSVGFKAINERVTNEVRQEALKIVFENYGKDFNDLHKLKKAYLVEKEIWNEEDQIYENAWSLYRDENGNLTRPPAEMFKEGKVKTETNSEHEKLRTVWNAKEHEVIVRNNGDFAVIVFPEKQLSVAQAFNNQNTMVEFLGHVFDARKLGETWIFRWLGAWTNFMKAMFTGYNPTFPLRNLPRDQFEAALTQNIRLNTRMTKIPENIPVAVRAIVRNMSGKYDPKNRYDVEMRNCREAGGFTGFTHEKTIAKLERELKRELKRSLRSDKLVGKTWDKLTGIFRFIEYYNRLFEDTTRFGVYLDARDKGLSIKDSAFESRNASVDFNMKGKGTRPIEAWYAFYKVGMAALQKNLQLPKINSKKFWRNAVTILVFGAIEAMLNDWATGEDEDEDEMSKYERINHYVRENYLNIVLPFGKKETYLRLPLSQFWRGFHAMGVTMYDYFNDRVSEGEALGRIISNFIAGMAPIDVTAFVQEGKFHAWGPLVPTPAKPIQEIIVNRDFMGNKIAYEAFTKKLEEDLANSGLHKKYVNPAAKFITDVLFESGGGISEYKMRMGKDGKLKYVPSFMDVNPSKIEHLISGYLGGTGKFINDILNTLNDFVTVEEEYNWQDWPFINDFVRSVPDEKWIILDKYYGYKKHIDRAKIIRNKAKAERDDEQWERYKSGDYRDAIKVLDKCERKLKQKKDERGSDLIGLENVDELGDQMIELRKDAVKELDKLNINKP